MEKDHYLFLNSQNSKYMHSDNSGTDFTIELPKTYELNGHWECGLKEISVVSNEEKLYVCSDVCEESYVEDTMLPMLRVLYNIKKGKKKESYFLFNDPCYIKVKVDKLSRIRMFIRGSQLQSLKTDNFTLYCTLHLRRWK